MNFVNQFHPISICQACVARGADDEDLMRSTQSLTKAIADYKVAAKTVKGLESQSRPKAKAKAKAGSAPAPSAWLNGQVTGVWLFERWGIICYHMCLEALTGCKGVILVK